MKRQYAHWWYPSFANPDKNAAIQSVHLCTEDNEINIVLREPPPLGCPPISKLVCQYNGPRIAYQDTCLQDDISVMVVSGKGGQKIMMDEIAKELDALALIHPSLDSTWFHELLAEDKRLAGLQPDAPADYDVWPCQTPLLEKLTCSKYGGTIELREQAARDFTVNHVLYPKAVIGPVGEERNLALQKLKKTLLTFPTEEVTFTASARHPNQIHFTWDSPCINIGNDRAEYLSMGEILKVLGQVIDVSPDIKGIKEQFWGRSF